MHTMEVTPTAITRRSGWSRLRRAGIVALVALTALPLAVLEPKAEPAHASFGINQRLGIDGCGLQNSVSRAYAFWKNTPYYTFGMYLGGSVASCPVTSASFVAALRDIQDLTYPMAWQIMPIWVGPQAPCSGFATRMSSNTTTAYEQGRDQAVLAYQKLQAFNMSTLDTPVIYDLEPYTTTNTGCVNAVKAFMRGWTYQLHLTPAQKSGVYGSTCASGLANFAGISPRPDFITGAAWDNNRNTRVMPCISSSSWSNHQRHKQYRGDHFETWNNVRVEVDSDCSDGPVWPGPDQWDIGHGCV